ncbi:MAG: class I SAM-dependent methyltransferase [Thermodesulfobacteriota bacterium]|nr:class I SAM-dependent methyltransferase [Thermodesulfobacteriota bacterium]
MNRQIAVKKAPSKELHQGWLRYFEYQRQERNPIFRRRFKIIDFAGLKVLEIGCGLGSLCIDVAASGARQVIGLDINAHKIDFANKILRLHYPQFVQTIRFSTTPLEQLQEADFDIILSKAAFEHCLDLEGLLLQMKKRLKPGGRVYSGFGPLYHSPYGDHGYCKALIPWGHLILSEDTIVTRLNRKRKVPIRSISDLGLNRLSFNQYMSVFAQCGLRIVDLRTNVHENLLYSMLSNMLHRIPFLGKYFTFNIYCILEK